MSKKRKERASIVLSHIAAIVLVTVTSVTIAMGVMLGATLRYFKLEDKRNQSDTNLTPIMMIGL